MRTTCTLTEMPTDNGCIDIMKGFKMVILDFRFTIYVKAGAEPPSSETLREDIMAIIDDTNYDLCSLHTSSLLECERVDMTCLKVAIALRTKDKFRNLQLEYNRVFDRTRDATRLLTLQGKNYFLAVTSSPLATLPLDNFALAKFIDGNSSCLPSIAMTDIQFCKGVLFHRYTHSDKSIIIVNGVNLFPNEYIIRRNTQTGIRAVYTCLSTYVSRRTHIQSSSASLDNKKGIILASVVIIYVFHQFVIWPLN